MHCSKWKLETKTIENAEKKSAFAHGLEKNESKCIVHKENSKQKLVKTQKKNSATVHGLEIMKRIGFHHFWHEIQTHILAHCL